ncbi:MAG: protein kinase [Peptococcaceae bacterium]|nr:protein kinase [Peptococcaceae bacterium]
MPDVAKDAIFKYEPLWGAWQVVSLIGQGSYGTVYKICRKEFLDNECPESHKAYFAATKIISIPNNESEIHRMENEGMDESSIRNFFEAVVTDILGEIEMMSEFRGNSHIVCIEDYQIIERHGFPVTRKSRKDKPQASELGWDVLIRMELLNSLPKQMKDSPLSISDVIKLGIHICRALELCEMKNIIHRDIKPDNIFVSQYGDYKLGDFGLARRLDRNIPGLSRKGTDEYMAPEVFRGDEYNIGADIYSLGILMYTLLNRNRFPFLPVFPQPILPGHLDEAMRLRRRGEQVPELKQIATGLNEIVLRACAYESLDRFTCPTEMRKALETCEGNRNYQDVTGLDETLRLIPSLLTEQTCHTDKAKQTEPKELFSSEVEGDELRQPDNDNQGVAKLMDVVGAETKPRQGRGKKGKFYQITGFCLVLGLAICASILMYLNLSASNSKVEPTKPILIYSNGIEEEDTLPASEHNSESVVPQQTESAPNFPIRAKSTSLDYRALNLSDKQLAVMIDNGQIPEDVKELVLHFNNISDVTPLQVLKDLEALDLSLNRISNVGPLGTLTNLTSLDLSNNAIRDLSPLRSLVGLKVLDISSNNINDISGLKGLVNLKQLTISSRGLTEEKINDLEEALPNCRINVTKY